MCADFGFAAVALQRCGSAVPLIWILLVFLAFLARTYLNWTVDSSVAFLLLALSAAPLFLLLLDFVAAKGAVVGNDWIKIDFSKTVVEGSNARREASSLPDNILSPAESITDSGGMKMIATIRKATITEIVCIDVKDGNAWWKRDCWCYAPVPSALIRR